MFRSFSFLRLRKSVAVSFCSDLVSFEVLAPDPILHVIIFRRLRKLQEENSSLHFKNAKICCAEKLCGAREFAARSNSGQHSKGFRKSSEQIQSRTCYNHPFP